MQKVLRECRNCFAQFSIDALKKRLHTSHGIPIVYDLVLANTDERAATKAVIDYFSFCDIFADKGFLGLKWKTRIFDQTNNLIWTPRRTNQKIQTNPGLDRWLSKSANGSKVFSMKSRIPPQY